jgi:electron transfer flavoprotein-quinone oxidoreductase
LMEAFKNRPEIEVLIAGGHPVEYSAHAIPEGGVQGMPELVSGGIILIGDAAGLCLNQGVTLRGMDMAMVSGVLAARAILEARRKRDFSAESLAMYMQLLRESSIYHDLTTFQHMPEILSNPRLFDEYPEVASQLLQEILWVGANPKQKLSSTVMSSIRRKLLRPAALSDLWHMRKV